MPAHRTTRLILGALNHRTSAVSIRRAAAPVIAAVLLSAAGCGGNSKGNNSATPASHCTLLAFDTRWAAAHDDFAAQQESATVCTLLQHDRQIGTLERTKKDLDQRSYPDLLRRQGFRIERAGTATLALPPTAEALSLVILPSGRAFAVSLREDAGEQKARLIKQIVPLLVA